MPIKIPSDLPAYDVLKNEGVMVMDDFKAKRQDIRPLRIGLLNLMPKKIQTENQFARVIGATPLQIELSLIKISAHETKNTAANHMETFYRSFEDVKSSGDKFDGLIITGAPIEHLDFETVSYWKELIEIFKWTQSNVHSVFGVCWGGMAMLYHFYGIKNMISKKRHLAASDIIILNHLLHISEDFLTTLLSRSADGRNYVRQKWIKLKI